MKQIIFIFMAILLATGIASAQNKAVISADETSFDFGTIKEANGNVSHTFKIKNTGEAPLVLTRVIASCGCTTPEWTKEPIAPGKTGDIKITRVKLVISKSLIIRKTAPVLLSRLFPYTVMVKPVVLS